MKCVVHEFGYRAGEARADAISYGSFNDVNYTHFNAAQYGYRYDEVVLTDDARAKLVEAHRLVRWYEYLACRLEPGVELPDVGQTTLH